jgi:hypothetical protein
MIGISRSYFGSAEYDELASFSVDFAIMTTRISTANGWNGEIIWTGAATDDDTSQLQFN